jgi:hypothetical protein
VRVVRNLIGVNLDDDAVSILISEVFAKPVKMCGQFPRDVSRRNLIRRSVKEVEDTGGLMKRARAVSQVRLGAVPLAAEHGRYKERQQQVYEGIGRR